MKPDEALSRWKGPISADERTYLEAACATFNVGGMSAALNAVPNGLRDRVRAALTAPPAPKPKPKKAARSLPATTPVDTDV